MNGFFEFKDRNVIPIWRDFRRTMLIGELSFRMQKGDRERPSIDRALSDWSENRTVGTAADLLNSAYMAGYFDGDEIEEAMQLLADEEQGGTTSLGDIMRIIREHRGDEEKGQGNTLLEMDVDGIDRIKAIIDSTVFYKIIGRTREKAHAEPRNAIVWVELARLFSTLNQHRKAERAMLTAVELAPNNRFVLRAATRFFIHVQTPDRGLFYLRRAEGLIKDPWLLSAHIATSSSMGRFSPLAKGALSLVESRSFAAFDLTELACSLGMLEFNDGQVRKAKGLFNRALTAPNDNTLAQLRWVSNSDPSFYFNLYAFGNVINPFEAFSLEHFTAGNWQQAYDNCLKWFVDTPYSSRPPALASYIAAAILKDYDAGIAICEIGLKANGREPILLNNMVFAYALAGQIEKAEKYLTFIVGLDWSSLEKEQVIMLSATLGLAAMRAGAVAKGKELYKKALALSSKIPNQHYRIMIVINFTRELIVSKDVEREFFLNIMRSLKIEQKQQDCLFMRNEVERMLK